MAYGFVYVLGHEYMEGVFKNGMTGQTPLKRCDELSSGTAIPSPFDLLFYIEVDDPAAVESAMHDVFADFRVSDNREFFRVDLASIFEEFERFKEEEGAPLAMTYKGEGYLVCDAARRQRFQESAERFMDRLNEQPVAAPEAIEADQNEAV